MTRKPAELNARSSSAEDAGIVKSICTAGKRKERCGLWVTSAAGSRQQETYLGQGVKDLGFAHTLQGERASTPKMVEKLALNA